MKGPKTLVYVLLALMLASAVHSAYERGKPGAMMTEAAQNFLASLTPAKRAKAQFAFDDPNRVDWHFIPRARKGLPFKELDSAQARLGHAFLSSGLSRH